MVVANDILQANVGFDSDTNEVLLVTQADDFQKIPITSKREIASVIFNSLEKLAITNRS